MVSNILLAVLRRCDMAACSVNVGNLYQLAAYIDGRGKVLLLLYSLCYTYLIKHIFLPFRPDRPSEFLSIILEDLRFFQNPI